jgi:hypothetical protein
VEPTDGVALEARVVDDVEVGGVVEARVGDTLTLPVGRVGLPQTLRGAPPGMFVRADGVIDFDLGPGDVGRWEIRVVDRLGTHHAFVLVVDPPAGWVEPPARPTDDAAPPPDDVDPEPATVGRVGSGLTVGCALSLGASVGAQLAPLAPSPWETLGPVAARRTASPTALAACGTNTPVAPVLGFEVAPFATIREEAAPLTWWAGLQARVGDASFGPYATRNHWGYGVAARAALRTGRWGGPELRVGWVPPLGGAGRSTPYGNEDAFTASLAWTLEGWL